MSCVPIVCPSCGAEGSVRGGGKQAMTYEYVLTADGAFELVYEEAMR